jgi:hypothetical protein
MVAMAVAGTGPVPVGLNLPAVQPLTHKREPSVKEEMEIGGLQATMAAAVAAVVGTAAVAATTAAAVVAVLATLTQR